MYTSGFYACDTSAVRVVSSADNITPLPSFGVHNSDVRASEIGDDGIFEVLAHPVDEKLHRNEVSAFFSSAIAKP